MTNEVDILVRQIRSAQNRCEAAWLDWDHDAYDGACETADRYFKQLVEAVGADKAKELVNPEEAELD